MIATCSYTVQAIHNYVACSYLDDQITSSNNDDTAVIGGAVGGVILLLTITVVSCMVILCMRRSRKGSFILNDKVLYNATKPNAVVTLQDNPSYVVNKANTIIDDNDIPLTPNPSYNICMKAYTKANEDGYEQVYEFIQHSGFNDAIKMQANPSYGESTREDGVANFSAASDSNDYDYVDDGRFHSTVKIVDKTGSEANTKLNIVD